MKTVCGARREGATGVQWLCVKNPHGWIGAEEAEQFVESTSNGTVYPESMRHYMIAVEVDAAGVWRRAKERTDVR